MKSETLTPETLSGCKIITINEITGERKLKYSPQTAKEALENDGGVVKAHEFAEHAEMMDHRGEPEPIGCSIRRDDDTIEVHWYPIDDPEVARCRLQEVLTTHWRDWRYW